MAGERKPGPYVPAPVEGEEVNPPWADFLGARPADLLERQIFELLWNEWGYGLSLDYNGVLRLPVSRFDAFRRLRQEQLERAAQAMKGGT